ncbi:molybdenum ABC transporter ATP-binding protein [Roseovarius sp. A21]|uniref:Molybdenum ABC transporter ATP-binding protein n=1 Tax=Roseovarius bejariae TaxID=2576383 RepID=A0A844D0P5_9RHOB|nr:molybdenum ABC transporter ATP-binding protein [Roseovarius bejariae]MRU15804.1 molybdenum ABC transporter ATP-binding protein [Roseovarius bejariae]
MTLSCSLRHAFQGFTLEAQFEVPEGLTVLYGRSGSGKTTIVNAAAGLLRPEEGRMQVNDWLLFDTARKAWLPPHKRRIGYIFQEGRLFPHLTVRQNLRYGSCFAPKDATPEPMAHVVDMLGLGQLLHRRPAALSGGEKQRVAIGRALLAAPRMILADEPLSALDDARKAEVLPYFERLRDEVEIPILYVTHSAAEVARLATTVVALEDGRVIGQGTAAEVLGDPKVTPLGARAAGAVIEATIATHHPDGLTELNAGGTPLFLPALGQAQGSTVRVRIAAHDVILSTKAPAELSALNILSGTIHDIRSGQGPGAMVSLDTAAGRILARVTRRSATRLGLHTGAPCHAVIKSVALAPEDIGG